MKEALLGLLLIVGVIGINACGGSGGGGDNNKVNIIDTNLNYINLTTNLSSSSNTYSIVSGLPIRFYVGIIKNGEPLTPSAGSVIWSYTGPNVGVLAEFSGIGNQAALTPNGNTGTIVVKAQYETIFSTIQIHIVP
jgi:hypothetical protein